MNEETIQQQINLLDKRFREDESLFSSRRIVQVWFLAIAGMLLYSGYSYYNVTALEKRAAIKQDEADHVAEVLKKVETLTPQGTIQSLEVEVEQLKKEKERKLQVKDLLIGTDLGNIAGFSQHLEGLAKEIVPNVWLTSINIEDGGKSLGLLGGAMDPKLVPQYLQKLSNERSFAGSEFRTFFMGVPEKEDDKKEKQKDKSSTMAATELPYINFRVQTLIQEEEDGRQ